MQLSAAWRCTTPPQPRLPIWVPARARSPWHWQWNDRNGGSPQPISATNALQVARANAERLGARNVDFFQGDWLAALPGRQFELIVSNPPYVAAHDPALGALRYEPAVALTPGATGLEALAAIIVQAPAHLLAGGWLVLEHGAGHAADVTRLLVGAGFTRVRCHPDLAGRDRVTEAQWPYKDRRAALAASSE